MYRIALVDLQNDADEASGVIDPSQIATVTLDGRDHLQMVPVSDPENNTERTHDGG